MLISLARPTGLDHGGGREPPTQRCSECWVVAGRRSGKTRIAAAVATYVGATLAGQPVTHQLTNQQRAYVNRGDASGTKGDLDRAIADFDQAIRLDPKDAKAYHNRGIAREMKRSLQQALADFKMYSQLAPSEPDGREAVERVLKKLRAR